jgi:hypothetical protein
MKYNPSIVAAYFSQQGLPPSVTEHAFHYSRKWRFDFAWLEQKVALEVEGGIWIAGGHSRGSGQVKDHEKMNNAALLGWYVLRCQPKELCTLETVWLIWRMLDMVNGRVNIDRK